MTLSLNATAVRRLALVKAGLLRPELLGLPSRSRARGKQMRERSHQIINHFGYLQLDTVSVTGARTHGIVLASRLAGMHTGSAEELLQPGEPLFEYWGHEACWLPLALYPVFAFRRREFRVHPWWGDLLTEHPKLVRSILDRARIDGPFRSVDLEGERFPGWWNIKLAKRVAEALWSSGELVIRERRNFQRIYDLTERVIPAPLLSAAESDETAYKTLLLRALAGHGWATTGLLASTWRLRNRRPALEQALKELAEEGSVVPCDFAERQRTTSGWLLASDLEIVDAVENMRVRGDAGVLLSPFDPVLWDRARVGALFGFEQVLEIYKPAAVRQYGYYCMPLLAGDRLIGRVDLKANRTDGSLHVVSRHDERSPARDATRNATSWNRGLTRYAAAVGLELRQPAG